MDRLEIASESACMISSQTVVKMKQGGHDTPYHYDRNGRSKLFRLELSYAKIGELFQPAQDLMSACRQAFADSEILVAVCDVHLFQVDPPMSINTQTFALTARMH